MKELDNFGTIGKSLFSDSPIFEDHRNGFNDKIAQIRGFFQVSRFLHHSWSEEEWRNF